MAIPGLYEVFQEKWVQQAVWMISDTHFEDADCKLMDSGWISPEEAVSRINVCVGRKDTFIHLGDVGNVEWIKKIHGYKVLIMGNHDSGRTNYERRKVSRKFSKEIFQKSEALDEMKRIYPDCQYSITEGYDFHSPFEYWEVFADNLLFDEVYEGPVMIGPKLILSHEPLDSSWAFNIHGHDHSGAKAIGHFNLASNVVNYKPVQLNRLMKQGLTSGVLDIHRDTINAATIRKIKRNKI